MNTLSFQHETLPSRVVFGSGTLKKLPEEADRLNLRRVLIVSTTGQRASAERVKELLGSAAAGVFTNAAMHTPAEVTQTAMAQLRDLRVDGFIAIGGGSAIGLSKALALRTDLPQIVIPTTYAGSEATAVLGETIDNVKHTQRSERILPETIVYDVDLTLGLPVAVSMASGVNAMAHAVEALYATDRNPLTGLIAEAALHALVDALPEIHSRPHNPDARATALWGAWLCGCCLGITTMGLHHKLCHTLGGMYGLPHAATHAVLLPHTLAYNLPFAPDARRTLFHVFVEADLAMSLAQFIRRLDLPYTLAELGMAQSAIEAAAEMSVSKPYPNPRPLDCEAIRGLLIRAWSDGVPLAGQ